MQQLAQYTGFISIYAATCLGALAQNAENFGSRRPASEGTEFGKNSEKKDAAAATVVIPSPALEDREVADRNIQKSDLAAQESMARAAWAMFITAVVQIVAGGVGLVFVYRTLRATRDTLDVTREVGDDNLRPWLSIIYKRTGKIYPVMDEGDTVAGWACGFLLRVKNHGSSPASNVGSRIMLHVLLPDTDTDAIVRGDYEEPPTGADSIFPGEEKSYPIEAFLTRSEVEENTDNYLTLFLHGYVSYESTHIDGIGITRFDDYVTSMDDNGMIPFNTSNPEWYHEWWKPTPHSVQAE